MAGYQTQQLGNYQLVRHIGRGAFSDVYLGIHVHLKTPAAIKLLHTELTSTEVLNFRNEARTIARLEHPNIVRVLDFGIEKQTPYIVMVFAPNGTLRQCHPKGSILSLSTVVSYIYYANRERLAICPQSEVYSPRYQTSQYLAYS